ncbi:E3 ubiquitin-protein ligase TRIM39-like [Pseudorasbora parva]|uniref:E3 ubiquitin-protein ligase TRIM39-like n=1 Tax=Pseudorasbora parva TaxID=51549 RepID=UPI00351E1704
MASSSGPALNEELQCSICLEVFTDPVTTPCGHNFCRSCLVFCDVCDERKQKAVKTCLTCQSSYCETHLEPHLRVPRLKKHKLINAVENLEDYICQKHERPLELFCRDDQMRVCLSCAEGEHRTHKTVPIEEESREKKQVQTQTDVQQKKIQEIEHSEPRKNLTSSFLTSSKTVHISNGMIIGLGILLVAVLPYAVSMCVSVRGHSEQLKMMEEPQKRAEDLNKELQQEITELKRRNIELEQEITDLKRKTIETGLTWAQKFAVDVTLDPDTANPYLILSDDGTQVYFKGIRQDVTANPMRFKDINVMAKQGFSSGRFYFEVQVKGNDDWKLGVARESVNRKELLLTPDKGVWILILMQNNRYLIFADPPVSVSVRVKPDKVGVFVDYEEGLVSFYDVKSRSHLCSFTGQTFTDKLYPFLNPGLNLGNSTPLIITPVW